MAECLSSEPKKLAESHKVWPSTSTIHKFTCIKVPIYRYTITCHHIKKSQPGVPSSTFRPFWDHCDRRDWWAEPRGRVRSRRRGERPRRRPPGWDPSYCRSEPASSYTQPRGFGLGFGPTEYDLQLVLPYFSIFKIMIHKSIFWLWKIYQDIFSSLVSDLLCIEQLGKRKM